MPVNLSTRYESRHCPLMIVVILHAVMSTTRLVVFDIDRVKSVFPHGVVDEPIMPRFRQFDGLFA